jgi:hypothetical protein
MSEDEPGYGLLMPFVVCESQGGPYADQPFVSGYRLGHLDAQLEYEQPPSWEGYVAPADVPQVDLLAMRHGYAMEAEPHDDDWTSVTLRRAMLRDPAARQERES